MHLDTCTCWRVTNLCPKILVIHTPCCTDGSMHLTVRPLVLCNRNLAHGRCAVVASLKVMRLLAVPLQVWQDVQAHHDVFQQLLYLLFRLLHKSLRRGEWDWLKVIVMVWGEAVTTEKLGVRGIVGVRWLFGGVGGGRLKNQGLWFMTLAWLDRGGLTVCTVRLWKKNKSSHLLSPLA